MTLKEEGFRFMISPDKIRARWCNPVEIPHFCSDWSDHTDTPEKEFIEFLEKGVDASFECL